MGLTDTQLLFFIGSALIIGFSKTSIGSIAMIAVTLMASVFPAKGSIGIVLMMILLGDLVAITSFRKKIDWKIILKLFPFVFLGSFCGYFILRGINNENFRRFLGVAVLISIIFDFYLSIIGFSKVSSKGFTVLIGWYWCSICKCLRFVYGNLSIANGL